MRGAVARALVRLREAAAQHQNLAKRLASLRIQWQIQLESDPNFRHELSINPFGLSLSKPFDKLKANGF